ncbi:unknown [Clostridium sp. CAG:226]|nr:unknown [Clostridium sp. CAG:226]
MSLDLLVNVMLSVVLASVNILLERVISSALSGTYCGVVPQPLFPAARAGTAHSIITAASAKQINLRVFIVQSSLTVLFFYLGLMALVYFHYNAICAQYK